MIELICLGCKRKTSVKELPKRKIRCRDCGCGMLPPEEFKRRRQIVDIKTHGLLTACKDIGKKNKELQEKCFLTVAEIIGKDGASKAIQRMCFEEEMSLDEIDRYIEDLREECREVFRIMKSSIAGLRKRKKDYI